MTSWRRVAASVALASFTWAMLGAPVIDSVWFHVGPGHADAQHIESADGPGCHAERCTLGAATAPVASAGTLARALRTELLAHDAAPLRPDDTHLDRLPTNAPGSRAPPA